MPQKRSGIGAADELRMEAMPHSSHVQPAMVGSTGSVSMAVFVLSVSIVGVTFDGAVSRRHSRRGSRMTAAILRRFPEESVASTPTSRRIS